MKDVKAGFAAAMDKEFGKAASAAKRVPVEGRKHDLGHGDVVIAAITSCTNTSNPTVMVGAGLARPQCARQGPHRQAVGQDVARPRLPGGRRVSRQVRAAEGPRQARLQSRRLWLHHLHRQFRAAAAGDFQGHQRQRSRRRGGAVGQSQFRRPRQPGRPRQLSRLAAAGRRLCDRRHDEFRLRQDPARRRQGRQEGVPQGHLAVEPRDRDGDQEDHHQADVRAQIRQRVQGRLRPGARSRSRAA